MRLLLFHFPEFSFKTHSKVVPDAPDDCREGRVESAVVVFERAEPKDEADAGGVETKLSRNVKRLAGRFATRTVAIDRNAGFSHLGSEPAPPEFARGVLDRARARPEAVGHRVEATPFGHFSGWRLSVAGESLAQIRKEL